MKNVEEKLDLIVEACDDKKAQDIAILDIRDNSTIADYFVVASGSSNPQTRAIANDIIDKLKDYGIEKINPSGFENPRWIVIDYSDIVVHIFHENERQYYNLERLWEEMKN